MSNGTTVKPLESYLEIIGNYTEEEASDFYISDAILRIEVDDTDFIDSLPDGFNIGNNPLTAVYEFETAKEVGIKYYSYSDDNKSKGKLREKIVRHQQNGSEDKDISVSVFVKRIEIVYKENVSQTKNVVLSVENNSLSVGMNQNDMAGNVKLTFSDSSSKGAGEKYTLQKTNFSWDFTAAKTEVNSKETGDEETNIGTETENVINAVETINNTQEGYTVEPDPTLLKNDHSSFWIPILLAVILLLLGTLIVGAFLTLRRRRRQSSFVPVTSSKDAPNKNDKLDVHTEMISEEHIDPKVGIVHNIGARPSQQDSFGTAESSNGLLCIVADGMGGLADGDKVSKKIVETMRDDLKKLPSGNLVTPLYPMVKHVNSEINNMLGPDVYKSGSTLVAVLVEENGFEWVSVGDSRLYLIRNDIIMQLNREHDYESELLLKAVNNNISFSDARSDPQKDKITSFIGMGTIKYLDGSRTVVPYVHGDKLMLTSDGVFNTLSDQEICSILSATSDVVLAAKELEKAVLSKHSPKQDNFTSIIIGL